jgi:predicted membrane protein
MQDKLRKFMMGRYGVDQLNKFLLGTAVIIVFLSIFFRNLLFDILPVILLILCYYRIFSKNISQRYKENQKYLAVRDKLVKAVQNYRTRRIQNRNYRIYVCPTCNQKIRVPKGKGKICITCPRCKAEFIRRS